MEHPLAGLVMCVVQDGAEVPVAESDRGLPDCALCGGRVERLEWNINVHRELAWFRATCHGEREEQTIELRDVIDNRRVVVGPFFVPAPRERRLADDLHARRAG